MLTFILLFIACCLENKTAKAVLSILGAVGLFIDALILSFIMPIFGGRHSGWLPWVVYVAAYGVFSLFIWKAFKVKARVITAASIFAAVILLLVGLNTYDNYRDNIPEVAEEISLEKYMPFGWESDPGNTLVKSLSEESTLTLTENLPRLDGATALYPLYSAFARATYPEAVYYPSETRSDAGFTIKPTVACSKTSGAFENLINGEADIAFLAGVSDEQRLTAETKGLTLELTPIGREAFVFFVNSRNPVDDISADDIRRIYSGEISNWREVGGKNNAIKAYQRPTNSGSQTMLEQIMGGVPILPAPKPEIIQTMLPMYKSVADYKNYKNALGYSFLFYIRDMTGGDGIKLLSIDGIAPTRENIASGSYPFADEFYAVTAKRGGEYLDAERAENIDSLIDWIRSPQGQYLVDATGYVSLG